MTTNRLAGGNGNGGTQWPRHFSALDYAQQAKERGLTALAKQWEKAAEDGWDERNYCPEQARAYWEKINAANDGRRGKKPLMDRRGEVMSESETFELNRQLEEAGAIARYRRDGSRYLITDAK